MLFFHRLLNSKFSNRFNFTCAFFEKITSCIIQFSHVFLLKRSWQLKLLKLLKFTISDSKTSMGELFLCRPSCLTISLCSPNHYDLKVQSHELAIFIRCTWWLRMIIHFSRSYWAIPEKIQTGGLRIWNLQGWNSMCNFQGWPRKNSVEFPGVFVFGLGISKGTKHYFVEYPGLSFALSGISRGKVKKGKMLRDFRESVSSTPLFGFFLE